jgi:hypothetical protein
VIVPWDSMWWFRASGSLRVGYIVKENSWGPIYIIRGWCMINRLVNSCEIGIVMKDVVFSYVSVNHILPGIWSDIATIRAPSTVSS